MATSQDRANPRRSRQRRNAAPRVLKILNQLSTEIRPDRPPREISLESALDRDLGIDSLARMELLLRLERAFNTNLSEQAVMRAETPADLVAAIGAAAPRAVRQPMGREPLALVTGRLDEPRTAETIPEAVAFHLTHQADRLHLRLLAESGEEQSVSYAELWRGAQGVAAGLRDRLVRQGEAVAIMLPTCVEFFHVFLGILLAGAVPVPVYPPMRRSQIGEHLVRQAGILRNAKARLLVTTPEARPFGRLITAQVETITDAVTLEGLRKDGDQDTWPSVASDAVALLQYTSGSTGEPKGVVLTHQNLLSNIRGMGRAFKVTGSDVVVSWLPLYHDMGLIGTWMGSLYYGLPVVIMSPLAFLARPERWLWAIHRYRGTISAAPNFAYELCASKIGDDVIAGLDLSSWRMAGNGAEAVQAPTLQRFARRFEPLGFRPKAMTPMYGLAENAVALTTSPLDRQPRVQRLDRRTLSRQGRAEPAARNDPTAMTFVSSGIPIEGHEVRIFGPAGDELGERLEGHIQFRGPSATAGYHENPEKTAELIDGEWLNTGDTGYVDRGELFVTGRVKDIIVRAGRNLYPEEIETSVGRIPGVRAGRVAVFASPDPRTGSERLVVVAETRDTSDDARRALTREIGNRVTAIAETPPEDIVLAKPGAVLKTANGKLRRAACQELYQSGRLGRPPTALWRQIAGLMRASILPRLRRWRRAAANFLYAVHFQFVYRAAGPVIWSAMMLTPGLRRRRRLFGTMSKLTLRLLGIHLELRGQNHLPENEAFVLAVNHASFLDGLVIAACLPGDYAFTAKRELAGQPVAGRFLKRLGVAFVERIDRATGVEDTDRLTVLLDRGQSLVVFPEGTFDRRPGLRAFHMGAFVIAARVGAPVVPGGIQGTRSVLRGETWFAHRGPVSVTFERPIRSDGRDWAAAVRLRDRVRPLVLRHCGEPDLAFEPTALALRGTSR